MPKTILITGSTDGIGFETAKTLVSLGHNVLIHGRNLEKLKKVEEVLNKLTNNIALKSYCADLSNLEDVKILAENISKNHKNIDVIINNAGIYKTTSPITKDGLDIRFVVNTIAPYF